MIVLLWILNFFISWLNAWGCGKTWAETRANGGVPHFMNWMGATMSACGFTWCYSILAAVLGGSITHTVDGKAVAYLSAAQVQAVADMGYLMIIVPVIGSGLAITVHSWGVFYRERSFGSGAVAGWNSFAEVHNIYRACQDIPTVWDRLGDFLGGSSSSSDSSEGKGVLVVIMLAVVSLLAGILTTYSILTSSARSTARDRSLHYAAARP